MRLFVQQMTSHRCREILLLELEKIGSTYTIAELEKTDLSEIGPAEKYAILNTTLQKFKDETAGGDQCTLVDRMKVLITEAIHSEEICKTKFSAYLSKKLHYNYSYLSNRFSHGNGCTLKQYIIEQKIERAKQLLLRDRHTLSEISWMLHYSSVAHLSNQFKKVAGCTPTHFKMTGADRRNSKMAVGSRPSLRPRNAKARVHPGCFSEQVFQYKPLSAPHPAWRGLSVPPVIPG